MVVIPGPEESPGFLSLCHKQRAHILIFMARNKQQKQRNRFKETVFESDLFYLVPFILLTIRLLKLLFIKENTVHIL